LPLLRFSAQVLVQSGLHPGTWFNKSPPLRQPAAMTLIVDRALILKLLAALLCLAYFCHRLRVWPFNRLPHFSVRSRSGVPTPPPMSQVGRLTGRHPPHANTPLIVQWRPKAERIPAPKRVEMLGERRIVYQWLSGRRRQGVILALLFLLAALLLQRLSVVDNPAKSHFAAALGHLTFALRGGLLPFLSAIPIPWIDKLHTQTAMQPAIAPFLIQMEQAFGRYAAVLSPGLFEANTTVIGGVPSIPLGTYRVLWEIERLLDSACDATQGLELLRSADAEVSKAAAMLDQICKSVLPDTDTAKRSWMDLELALRQYWFLSAKRVLEGIHAPLQDWEESHDECVNPSSYASVNDNGTISRGLFRLLDKLFDMEINELGRIHQRCSSGVVRVFSKSVGGFQGNFMVGGLDQRRSTIADVIDKVERIHQSIPIIHGLVETLGTRDSRISDIEAKIQRNAKLEFLERDLIRRIKAPTGLVHLEPALGAILTRLRHARDEMEVIAPMLHSIRRDIQSMAEMDQNIPRVVFPNSLATVLGCPAVDNVWVLSNHHGTQWVEGDTETRTAFYLPPVTATRNFVQKLLDNLVHIEASLSEPLAQSQENARRWEKLRNSGEIGLSSFSFEGDTDLEAKVAWRAQRKEHAKAWAEALSENKVKIKIGGREMPIAEFDRRIRQNLRRRLALDILRPGGSVEPLDEDDEA